MPRSFDFSHDEPLPFFPVGLPDETVGSRISRYHILRGLQSNAMTFKQIFNRPPFRVYTMLPTYLDRLAMKLPGSAEGNLMALRDEGTLVPLLHRFADAPLDVGGALFLTHIRNQQHLGAEAKGVNYCRVCLSEDQKRYGVAYIHRAHQIPGVTVCWRHSTGLFDRCCSCLSKFASSVRIVLFPWIGCVCGAPLAAFASDTIDRPSTIAREFAKFAQQILNAPTAAPTSEQLVHIYMQRAAERGLGRGGNRSDRKKLYSQIDAFYGSELLSQIDPTWRHATERVWCGLLHPTTIPKQKITRHLVFSFFLFIDADLFLSRTRDVLSSRGKQATSPDAILLGFTPADAKEGTLLYELRHAADLFDYDQHQLWEHHFYDMKKLLLMVPNSTIFHDVYLHVGWPMRSGSATKFRELQLDEDIDRARRIDDIARGMLWENERPVRITRHRLRNFHKLNISFRTAKLPLTRFALYRGAESLWHFAARRVLWILMGITDPATSNDAIAKKTGLNIAIAKAILIFFPGAPRGCEQSMNTVKAVLAARAIGLNWQGPGTNLDSPAKRGAKGAKPVPDCRIQC